MVNGSLSISDAARQFADSLSSDKHMERQEALRFARWFGEERRATDIKPSDLESYVETYGASAPNASARADALKAFLAYAHKHHILPSRLVSHVRVRKPAGRRGAAALAGPPQMEVRLTTAGRQDLEAELERLKAERPKIAESLHAAMVDKDFKENAPLDAAREAQGLLEGRIREIEAMLRLAVIADDVGEGSSARVGCNVVISNIQTGAKQSFLLVNPAEAKPGTGRLSVESPVGQALVGHRSGDEVQVTAPSGIVFFRIESIET